MKVILFNGPPGSGKDHCADYLEKYLKENTKLIVHKFKFAKALKETTHRMFGFFASHDAFEREKDIPHELLGGLTPRQAYIKVSEEMIKPVLGEEHWGNVFVTTFQYLLGEERVIIISDCGFLPEIQPIKRLVGADNMIIVQLHREGHNFSNDSRGYVTDPEVASMEIKNVDVKDLHTSLQLLADVVCDVKHN